MAAGALVTAADAPEAAAEEAVDFESLYASVTPSAHSEMGPEVLTAAERNRRKRAAQAAARTAAVEQAGAGRGPAAMGGNTWKRLTFALVAVIAVIAVAFIVGNTVLKPGGSGSVAAVSPSPSGPVLDAVRVQALMAQLQANPKDEATLTALGDEYFKAEQFATAATWYDKALVEAPKNVALLLARGASAYNAGDDATAKKFWEQAVAIDPKNQEAYYDLGFMYMNSNPPDWTGVQTAWSKVIAIDPSTQLAQVVQQHLDSLASASMIPGASGSASGSPSPSGSPAASTSGSVVNQTALNQTYGSATLSAPANQAFTIHFGNQEAGVPHDIQIADPAGNVFFKGETVTGPKAIDYAVKALPAGSYPFHCSIHSTMTGTLVVGG
jgi:tetratricopeptide (TPR) repeat protein